MHRIITIALNTFRESIRDRIFYSLLAFAIIMLAFSLVLGSLTIGDEVKIIKDFGLGAIGLFGVLIAIFVGINLVYKEMEKRTIYVILANPIARWQFVLGKYWGLSLILLIEVVTMAVGVLALCYYKDQIICWDLLIAIFPIWLELQLILAFALFFSTFSSPFLSGLFTLSVYIIGHLTMDFKQLALGMDNPVMKKTADFLYYFFPNLEALNYKSQIVHSLPISVGGYVVSVGYILCYGVVIMLLAVTVFNRRDIR